MRKIILIIVLSSVISFVHCNGQAIHVTLTNQEAFDRGSEIVELPWIELKGKLPSLKHDNVMVLDESGRESLIVQSTENDLLFQVNLTAGLSCPVRTMPGRTTELRSVSMALPWQRR
jgi:hypothetical protein